MVVPAKVAEPYKPNRVNPQQSFSPGPPPRSPAAFDPDPNKLMLPTNAVPATNWSRSVSISSNAPPVPPPQFNPAPGASLKAPAGPPAPSFRPASPLPPGVPPPGGPP